MTAFLLRLCTVALSMILPLLCGGVQAQVPDIDRVVQVDMLPGWREADGRHIAGLRIRLAPGWKTYWRVPGEGGIPPQFNLAGSENISGFAAHMPRPKVYREKGLLSIGYSKEVVFPLEIQAREKAEPIRLRGVLKLGVCEAVCIPADVPLNAVLAAPGQPSSTIRQALSQLPLRASAQPNCELSPSRGALQLSLRIPVSARPGEYPVIETSNREVWVATSRVWRDGEFLYAVADLYPPQGAPYVFDRSGLRVTVLSEDAAQELTGCAPR